MSKSTNRVDLHIEELMQDLDLRADYTLRRLAARISVQIKSLRETLGMNQSELAKRVDTVQSRISQMEDPNYGKLTLSSLAKVAEALNCNLVVSLEPKGSIAFTSGDEDSENQIPSAHVKSADSASHGYFRSKRIAA